VGVQRVNRLHQASAQEGTCTYKHDFGLRWEPH
jgi:hypothetical protein